MRQSLRAAGLLAAGALLLTACSSTSASSSESATPTAAASAAATAEAAEVDTFPVTIDHVFGTTTIESQPQRVATVAWANHEVPIALGVIPVGMAKVTWGDDDTDGLLPWVAESLAAQGAQTPVLFDETDGIDFEAVANTQPDVILAAYSGLTQEDYDKLSKIAPVVAYPEVAWGTSWQDMVRMNSKALGLSKQGEQLIADTEAQAQAALANHPELAGKKILFSWIDPADLSQIGFYTSHDTRPGFLIDMGFEMPSIVTETSANTTEFYASVSAEEADKFNDVDVFVTYGDPTSDLIAQMQADPLLGTIPAIKNGAVVILETGPLAASANPSPLSIGWGIDDYFALLAAPLQQG